MHSIYSPGGFLPEQKLLQKKTQAPALQRQGLATPVGVDAAHLNTPIQPRLSAEQAQAMKMLAFGARSTITAPGVKLEGEFIRQMKLAKNATEKAGLAEMLGRAGSINALPHLLKLLDEKQDVEVRTAAAAALSRIGSATNKNSFTATELTDALLDTYEHRKGKMTDRIMNPPELCYDEKLKECETRQKLMDEIKTLLLGVSELNVVRGRSALNDEYRKTLALTQMNETAVREMIRATELAEEEFHKELAKRYQKPLKEILNAIPKKELEDMQRKVPVKTPDGKTINLLEALQRIALLQEQQEQFASQLLLGLLEALSLHNDREANAAIKLALSSNHPEIKARSLDILSERNGLNYNSDVHPNLYARDKVVRQSAMQALLASPEQAAKQKTMELINPDAFFKVAGGVTRNNLAQYGEFLETIAENGDDYVQALSNRALNADYDLETRQIALLVLGMMVSDPAVRGVAPKTVIQAATAIKVLALDAPARSPQEHDALSLTATQLWVEMKDPEAIAAAIQMADSKDRKLSGQDQERLLAAVLRVLHEDSKSNGKDAAEANLQHRILDVMQQGKSAFLSPESEMGIRRDLRGDRVMARITPSPRRNFPRKTRSWMRKRAWFSNCGPKWTSCAPS